MTYTNVFIVGIGGIGTSAVAQWLKASGSVVAGSDATRSDITDWLDTHGIPVTIGEVTLPSGIDLLVFSDAVPSTHPLRQATRAQSIAERSYAELLGELTAGYRLIAVSGSHGKSSTTAMTGLLLTELGLDPTVVIGTRVKEWASATTLGNWRPGKSQWCVVEADEFNRHFHHLKPEIAVITSLDHDHVDTYPTEADYRQAFIEFIERTHGSVVIEASAARQIQEALHEKNIVHYSIKDSAASVYGQPSGVVDRAQQFDLSVNGTGWGQFGLRVPGVHMVANMLATIGVGTIIESSPDKLKGALTRLLGSFTGTWRRFELIGSLNDTPVYSDYAHHPTEVAALIAAAHQWFPDKKILFIFQPHHHLRTTAFAADFVRVFKEGLSATDRVILSEIYGVAGREKNAVVASTASWPEQIGSQAQFAATNDDIAAQVTAAAPDADIIIFAGAGSIDAFARGLVSHG